MSRGSGFNYWPHSWWLVFVYLCNVRAMKLTNTLSTMNPMKIISSYLNCYHTCINESKTIVFLFFIFIFSIIISNESNSIIDYN
jgi:hypothetical protein